MNEHLSAYPVACFIGEFSDFSIGVVRGLLEKGCKVVVVAKLTDSWVDNISRSELISINSFSQLDELEKLNIDYILLNNLSHDAASQINNITILRNNLTIIKKIGSRHSAKILIVLHFYQIAQVVQETSQIISKIMNDVDYYPAIVFIPILVGRKGVSGRDLKSMVSMVGKGRKKMSINVISVKNAADSVVNALFSLKAYRKKILISAKPVRKSYVRRILLKYISENYKYLTKGFQYKEMVDCDGKMIVDEDEKRLVFESIIQKADEYKKGVGEEYVVEKRLIKKDVKAKINRSSDNINNCKEKRRIGFKNILSSCLSRARGAKIFQRFKLKGNLLEESGSGGAREVSKRKKLTQTLINKYSAMLFAVFVLVIPYLICLVMFIGLIYVGRFSKKPVSNVSNSISEVTNRLGTFNENLINNISNYDLVNEIYLPALNISKSLGALNEIYRSKTKINKIIVPCSLSIFKYY